MSEKNQMSGEEIHREGDLCPTGRRVCKGTLIRMTKDNKAGLKCDTCDWYMLFEEMG